MEKSSSKRQVSASTESSSSKAAAVAAAGSGKRVSDVNAEITKLNRTLAQLEVDLVICRKQIDINLKRREELIQQICLLISILEKNLIFYNQADNARRKLEETLSHASFDTDDVDFEADENLECHEIHEDVVRAERQVFLVHRMCAHMEPILKLQKVENETVHATLCEKLVKIERSRQDAIARRRQLLKTRISMKGEK